MASFQSAIRKVVVENLIKNYGTVQAVRGVSFEINEGEIFGLLGPNGAGKTTTLECVIGLREPSGGRIEVCGIDTLAQPAEVKERIGAQLQATALQDKITPREALKLFSSFYRRRVEPEKLLERFSLTEKANAFCETLSGGQKQRLAVALALVNDPEFLLLDEPTAGLDPQARRELHGAVKQMRGDGRTVLLTTHYIEEAAQLCDRIAIIDHGKIVASGTPRQLTAQAQAHSRLAFRAARPVDSQRLSALPAVQYVKADDDGWMLTTAKSGETVIGLVKLLETEQNELLDLHIQRPTLEDVFLELTGHSLRD